MFRSIFPQLSQFVHTELLQVPPTMTKRRAHWSYNMQLGIYGIVKLASKRDQYDGGTRHGTRFAVMADH
jgi:hypothetical protein